jgi:adenosylmethionine-8-amino-7-oxononanoate aminotransferase
MMREVRANGYLLGGEYVDPAGGESFLSPEPGVARRIDDAARERVLATLSTQPTGDGHAGDHSLFAPPFTTTEDELAEMVDRFAAALRRVASEVACQLARHGPAPAVAARR